MARFLAVTILILSGSSAGIHYCFDGLEPAVSITFGATSNDNGDVENLEDYVDSDKLVLEENAFKGSFDISTLAIPPTIFLFDLPTLQLTRQYVQVEGIHKSYFPNFLPPLRAPPKYS